MTYLARNRVKSMAGLEVWTNDSLFYATPRSLDPLVSPTPVSGVYNVKFL
jgi:hypothetical protein